MEKSCSLILLILVWLNSFSQHHMMYVSSFGGNKDFVFAGDNGPVGILSDNGDLFEADFGNTFNLNYAADYDSTNKVLLVNKITDFSPTRYGITKINIGNNQLNESEVITIPNTTLNKIKFSGNTWLLYIADNDKINTYAPYSTYLSLLLKPPSIYPAPMATTIPTSGWIRDISYVNSNGFFYITSNDELGFISSAGTVNAIECVDKAGNNNWQSVFSAGSSIFVVASYAEYRYGTESAGITTLGNPATFGTGSSQILPKKAAYNSNWANSIAILLMRDGKIYRWRDNVGSAPTIEDVTPSGYFIQDICAGKNYIYILASKDGGYTIFYTLNYASLPNQLFSVYKTLDNRFNKYNRFWKY